MSDGFLWGVANSGYQCEGGFNGPHQPQNNWSEAEASGSVMRTGRATDFWRKYPEDFALSRRMGLNAFRLSVEWARVQPTHEARASAPPPFDEEALRGYGRMLVACREAGLEPVVTLQHFTNPAWLGTDAWLRDDIPELFSRFVRKTVESINHALLDKGLAPLHWFVTLNEPNMLVLNTYLSGLFPGGESTGIASGVQAFSHMLATHVRAYNTLHDLYEAQGWPSPKVSMNTFCSDTYWSEQMLLDLLFLRERGIARCDTAPYLRVGAKRLSQSIKNSGISFPTDPFVWAGRLFHRIVNIVAPLHTTEKTFSFFLDELDRSPRAGVLDFLGLDYYDPFTGHLFRPPAFDDIELSSRSLTGHVMAGLSRKWWDWSVLPEGLHLFCTHYHREFPRLGILIAENGMAQRCKMDNTLCSLRPDRVTRSAFLKAHIGQIHRLRTEGVPLLGYFHWSLTDNYEWGSFTPRFGIYHINYQNHAQRLPIDPFGDNPAETYQRLIRGERNAGEGKLAQRR